MVKRALASIVLVLAGCTGTGTPPRDADPNGIPAAATFAKAFGDARNNSALVAVPAAEGGYVFVGGWGGWVDPNGRDHDPDDMWVGKIDANGDSEWQLLLGEGFESDEPGEATIMTSQMHRTPDGGYIAAGSIKMRDTGHDFLIRKLSATGSVEWSRSYDSGAWREYSYLEGSASQFPDDLHSIDAPAAHDRIVDLYPATGGGYWAVGRSVANVRTARESFDTGHAQSIDDDYSSAGGNVFFGAESTVVLRLDEDGRLLGQHRYTEDQFDGPATHPIVRPAADGSALLVRAISSYDESSPSGDDLILIDRVGSNGQSLAHLEIPTEQSYFGEAVAVIQTDDSGASSARDGVRDDGFAILWPSRLLKVSRDLEVQWGGHFDAFRNYQAVEQLCEPGASGPVCHLLVGGHEYRPGGVPAFSRLEVLDDSGHAVSGRTLTTFQSIDALKVRGDRLQIVGSEQGHRGSGVSVETDAQLAQIDGTLHLFPRVEPAYATGGRWTTTIDQDGGFVYSYGGQPYVPYSAAAVIERSPSFAPRFDSEQPRGIVEVARGSYVAVADVTWGEVGETRPASRIWLVRITGGEIEWQRALTPESNDAYGVRGVVASGDGGVVLAVQTVSLRTDLTPGEERLSRAHRLIKVDASGAVVWQTQPIASGPFDTDRLVAVAGGYVALGGAGVLSRVDSDGTILWEKALSEATDRHDEPVPFESLAATDDGFVLLAAGGRDSGSIRVVRTDTEGEPIWSRGYSLQQQYFAIDLRQIIQTTDGGLLIAGDGILEKVVDGQNHTISSTPGQSNLAFIKLNRDGDLVWSRLYGGLMKEFFETMLPTADGGAIVAAHSDSMGDRREAWILRLGPDGLIAPGCNADLGAFTGSHLEVVSVLAPTATPLEPVASLQSSPLPAFTETRVPLERPQVITARQCLGTANSAEPLPAGEQVTLTIAQSGEELGVVTSEPRGISCGTGAGDQFCTATFPRGTRVVLRAEIEHFRSWGSACDEDSGGTSLECVVVLDADRSIEAEFGPPLPLPQFSLSFDIEGPGFINTDSGINCSEDTPVESCSGRFNRDTPISVTARPDDDWRGSDESARFLGWGGDCASSGTITSLTLRLDRDLHCIARFEPPNIELLSIRVSGAGSVRDVPPGTFNCREGIVGGGCEARFFPGSTTVRLQADPDLGQLFVGWGGDCASFGTAPLIDLVVSHNLTCTARFEQASAPARLNVELSDPNGTESVESNPAGIDCSAAPDSDCSEDFAPGTRVTLRASHPRVTWSGCDQVLDQAFCVVDVDTTPRSVRASFALR
ncbi:MAG TPA: hypothetical protein VJS12_09530 [Steroidobacteraceae bacterium]|nr:hypothetical protein [Steroidobacteraceae bacterium]